MPVDTQLVGPGGGPRWFEGFADQWTPVIAAAEVRRGRPFPTTLAGQRVVLFRDGSGAVAALLDRCPHRGVALSLGRVTDRGTLVCPFHGWEFAGDGACQRVPWCDLSDEKRARLGATALPVREAGGLVWIFTGKAPATGPVLPGPAVPEALTEPGWARSIHAEEWSTHWTRAMENMLDYPHLPFVHRNTIGRGLRAQAAGDGGVALETERTSFGMRITATADDGGGAVLEWRRPNCMVLHLQFGTWRMRQHVYCVPTTKNTTRMILVSSRDFLRFHPFGWMIDRSNLRILHEDRAVVESSDPPEVPPPSEERSVVTDAPTLAFRRWYFEVLVGGRDADVPLRSLVRSRAAGELGPGA